MPQPKLEDDGASIVLLGSFNPAIFQPAWLAAKGLIRETEASGAKIEVVHADLTSFDAGWLKLTVTHDRFVAAATDSAHEGPLRDLVVGIFELLEHTPTKRLGMNRSMHFKLADEAAWHACGDLLMPKGPWAGVVKKPGLLSLFVEGQRDDNLTGRLLIKVEPSTKHKNAVFVEINNDIVPPATEDATAFCVSTLRDRWDGVMRDARIRAEKLIAPIDGAT